MKSVAILLSVFALLAGGEVSAQQLYKWVGADGKITYSDTPPPKSARRVETKALGVGTTVDTENLPYEVAQAVKTSPVTLYTTTACTACDTARAFLGKRGVPFSEKTVTTADDVQRLKQAGGDGTLPLLLVGRLKRIGFESAAWSGMLSAAGYPETSKLPRTYTNPKAIAATPPPPPKVTKAVEPPVETVTDTPVERPASGFRF